MMINPATQRVRVCEFLVMELQGRFQRQCPNLNVKILCLDSVAALAICALKGSDRLCAHLSLQRIPILHHMAESAP
jgi:hypothetical protein